MSALLYRPPLKGFLSMGTTGARTILDIRNVTKRFGAMTAVDNISFSLEKGKLVTFLGPSGCGKTTLLRIISGFVEPDDGQIVLDGKDITFTSANERDTAMVFQNYALFPHLSVAQNISFGLSIMKMPKQKIQAEVLRLLDLVQLAGLGERKPHELSGGQQQRVAVARALSLNPKILLLDEPLSNLDANLRVVMRGEIRKLQRELDLSIIFVTHDQEEAMSISDLLVVMESGRVRQIGTPMEVYERPIDEFVANFIGHINFFSGEVADIAHGKIALRTADTVLAIRQPPFELAVGDRLKAVVRPESIGIAAPGGPRAADTNVIAGRIESGMYIGSIMRYTVAVGDQIVYVDESDPQYSGIFREGDSVDLVLKSSIHLLRESDAA